MRVTSTGRVICVEVWQLNAQDGRLQLIKTRIPAGNLAHFVHADHRVESRFDDGIFRTIGGFQLGGLPQHVTCDPL